ncbi:hypothetical protein QJS10_CPA07g00648 [Acorus calamus]|uniref:Secreted protein n=1 Tax=Acorus calamus TaxID=4465 RepID=A0AAV9EFE2_ACOCL|nr:hypothetical protein QJS10_CPA07g00648 [Acorus calamus]
MKEGEYCVLLWLFMLSFPISCSFSLPLKFCSPPQCGCVYASREGEGVAEEMDEAYGEGMRTRA